MYKIDLELMEESRVRGEGRKGFTDRPNPPALSLNEEKRSEQRPGSSKRAERKREGK